MRSSLLRQGPLMSVALATLAFLTACPEQPLPDPCEDSCATTVSPPGTYQVTYRTPADETITDNFVTDEVGFLAICNCDEILSAPALLVGPPNCGPARADPATLPNDPRVFNAPRILGVAEPDEGRIDFTIDAVLQDEPTFGLFAGDRYPDVLTGSSFGSVRMERDPAGNGRVYTLRYTATDDEGESCSGTVTACVPVVPGGTCIDDGALFESSVQPEIDLSVTMSDGPDPVGVGDMLTYTATVTNNSGILAQRLAVRIEPPISALEIVSVSGACEAGLLNTVFCELEGLAAGASTDLEVVIVPSSAGVFHASAQVSATAGSGFTDPDSSNNLAETQTQVNVTGGADLSVTKTASPGTVVAGEELTYTLTATNHGPEDALGVVLNDRLPASVTFVSASDGCTFANGRVECSPTASGAGLTVGQEAVFAITVRTTLAGNISNTVTVSSDTEDQDRANNSAFRPTVVQPGSDNCPGVDNPDQADADEDGVGDACDNCVDSANADQADPDGDDVGSGCDNCPALANANQANADGDAAGDLCDPCAADAGKTAPGDCGCGVPDTDANANGTSDCLEGLDVGLTVHVTMNGAPRADGMVFLYTVVPDRPCVENQVHCSGVTDAAGNFACPGALPAGDEICVYAYCCGGAASGLVPNIIVADQGGGLMTINVAVAPN